MKLAAPFAALALAACAGGPPAPDWQMATHSALANHQAAYFAGNGPAAQAELGRARAESSATGRPEAAARVELFRCALQTAALEFTDCPDYQRYAQDASPADRAYAAYLAGGDAAKTSDEPLSRLVAAGVALRAGRITPSAIAAAIDVASANGWRRPLLSWLGVELKRAEAAGDTEAAGRLRRRIELASGPPRR